MHPVVTVGQVPTLTITVTAGQTYTVTVRAYHNADGTVKSSQKISETQGWFTTILDDNDRFGGSVALRGDLNGDGVHDLAVGARLDDDGGSDRGAVYELFLNTNGTVKAHQKISEGNGGFVGSFDNTDRFGRVVAPLWDLDGDGVEDLAVGANGDDDGGTDRGALYNLFLQQILICRFLPE